MDKQILEFFRRIDQFGASYKPSYAYGEVQFKTSLGGFLSLILYGASLAYLIYVLIMWNTGQLLPKVTSLASEIETYSLNFEQVAQFCLRKHKSIQNQIDPFEPDNLVLLPMLYQVVDDELQQPIPLLSRQLSLEHNTILIELKNIILSNNENEQIKLKNIEYTIMFEKCNQNILPDGWNCAKEDRIISFFSQKQNQIFIRTFVNQFNTSTKQLEIIEQDYYASFDNKTTYYNQISFFTSKLSINTGFLFDQIEVYEFPSQVVQYVQQMDLDYFRHAYNNDVFIVFEFELGTLQQSIIVEYPKISEVLANIGSIISFFLFFSHIAYLISEKTLEERVVRTVIEMYYPEIKEVQFLRNWYSKIIEIRFQNRIINLENFMDKYNNLLEIARQKLCITNSLYEISRLQFIIKQLSKSDSIFESHNYGIKLQILEQQEQDQESQNLHQSTQLKVKAQDLKIENLEEHSLDELNIYPTKINPISIFNIRQTNIINNDAVPQNDFKVLGKTLDLQQNKQTENQKLSDEDFYILMQNQSRIKLQRQLQEQLVLPNIQN